MKRRTNAEMAQVLGLKAAMYRQRALIAGNGHAQAVQSLVHRARLLAERIAVEGGDAGLSAAMRDAERDMDMALDAWVKQQEAKP